MKFETAEKGIFGFAAVVILGQIALVGLLIYAVCHFVAKFW
jgi:hypothetical protein